MKKKYHISSILLCAGYSSRMKSLKPLLKLNGKTFIQTIIEKLEHVSDRIGVVVGYKADEIIEHLETVNLLDKVDIIENKQFDLGMFSSLKCALENTNADWYLYHFIDQPQLSAIFYRTLLKEVDSEIDWIQPQMNNRKGHPILFNNKVKSIIIKSRIDENLRTISHDPLIRKKFIDFSNQLIFQDIDTPKDFLKLI